MQKTWFVTGASRGFGAEIAKAAVRSGDRVVATARKRMPLVDRLGPDSGHMGFFEEMTVEDVQQQFATNLFGVFNVTWAALPGMRAARKGRIFNISSLGGLLGVQFGSLYCASKFALG